MDEKMIVKKCVVQKKFRKMKLPPLWIVFEHFLNQIHQLPVILFVAEHVPLLVSILITIIFNS